MKRSSIFIHAHRRETIVDGFYTLLAKAEGERPAGTLRCPPAVQPQAMDAEQFRSLTFTYHGQLYWDEGDFIAPRPMPPLSNVSSPRGAPMGRRDVHPDADPARLHPVLHLYRLAFEDGDYDEGGAYWGAPATVWRIYGELPDLDPDHVIDFYRRAPTREAAEALARETYPLATFAPPEPTGVHAEILKAMALAFFASAYADQADECGQPLSGEIMNQLPEPIDPAALHAATTLSMGIIDGITFEPDECTTTDAQRLLVVFMHLSNLYDPQDADRDLTPELFGHYCAMQAMGTGVGLESFGASVRDAIKIPYVEFGSHSLEQDYFEPVDDEDAEDD